MYTVYSSHDHFNENVTSFVPTNFFTHAKLINVKYIVFLSSENKKKTKIK